MYKYFKIGMLFVVMLACAQHKKPIGPNETKFKNIPNTTIKYKNNQAIEHYINSYRSIGAMEIYINDIPFKKYYKGDNDANYLEINDYILKSGTQNIRMRYIKESSTPFGKGFESEIEIQIQIQNLSQEIGDGKELKHSPPRIYADSTDIIGDFKGAGSFVYEDSFTFEATVPYEFVGWTESEDLTKLKPEQLEKQAVAAYQNIIDICKRKDREALFGLFYQLEFEKAQSKYYDKELFEKSTTGYDFMLEDSSVKFHPLENYEVKLYGNGKVVALESKTHLGQSALIFDFKDKELRTEQDIEGSISIPVLFHKPKGSDKLVPIR